MRLKTLPAILIASALLTSCRAVDVIDERGMTPLMRAAQVGDTATMHRLLADGADVNAEVPRRDMRELFTTIASMEDLPPSDIGFSALLYAAKSGRTRAAQILIANGAEVRHEGRFGETALGFALKRSDVALTRLLTAAGARVDQRQFANAVEHAPAAMVELLLKHGADPNGVSPPDQARGRNSEQPLLVTATIRGDPDVIKALIDARVNVNARDGNGWSALRWARDAEAQRSNPRAGEIVALLEAAGARDDGGRKAAALIDAVEKRDLARVRDAIRAGANPNARDKRGYTPVVVAAYNGSAAIVSALATSGAHLNLIPAHFGPTALTAAIENGSVATARALLESGAKADLRDGRGWSPLFVASLYKRREISALLLADSTKVDAQAMSMAARNGDSATVRMMLDLGADPNAGFALHGAVTGCAEHDNTALIALLLKKGANQRKGFALLHRAAARCKPETLRMLLLQGADVNERRQYYGETPLMSAAAAGNLDNVKVLIAAGADTELRDRRNLSALERAAKHPLVRQEIQWARDSKRTASK
jgi:ankyrin repeat protein